MLGRPLMLRHCRVEPCDRFEEGSVSVLMRPGHGDHNEQNDSKLPAESVRTPQTPHHNSNMVNQRSRKKQYAAQTHKTEQSFKNFLHRICALAEPSLPHPPPVLPDEYQRCCGDFRRRTSGLRPCARGCPMFSGLAGALTQWSHGWNMELLGICLSIFTTAPPAPPPPPGESTTNAPEVRRLIGLVLGLTAVKEMFLDDLDVGAKECPAAQLPCAWAGHCLVTPRGQGEGGFVWGPGQPRRTHPPSPTSEKFSSGKKCNLLKGPEMRPILGTL